MNQKSNIWKILAKKYLNPGITSRFKTNFMMYYKNKLGN